MRKILVYTSPGSDVLRAKALPVSGINGSIRKLIDEMAQVMEKAGGIGIAAPQVGESLQIAIVDIPKDAGGKGRIFLINPRILAAYGAESAPEGCLSLPGIEVPVTRYREITVETLDMENRIVQYKCAGILARAIQHEMDHLKGILIIDKARMLKRFLLKRRINTRAYE